VVLAAVSEVTAFLDTFLSFSRVLRSVSSGSGVEFYGVGVFTGLSRGAS
jgi:hypothetical protein